MYYVGDRTVTENRRVIFLEVTVNDDENEFINLYRKNI